MKKAILIMSCAMASAVSFAQTAIDSSKIKPYKADLKKVYLLQVPESVLSAVLQTSAAGDIPFLKSVKLPMDQLDNAQAFYNQCRQLLYSQYRNQFVRDSLQYAQTIKGVVVKPKSIIN